MVWIVLLVALVVGAPTTWMLVRRVRRRHAVRRPTVVIDPFEMLTLQFRLATLAAQIQRIEQDQSTLARAHHLRATQFAYDAVLRQACALVGLTDSGGPPRTGGSVPEIWVVDEDERMRQELELCARGWSW